MYNLMVYFLLFITYSFIGWLIEIISSIIVNNKIVNRGFLIGPYCPIYGFGSLGITIFITSYKSDLLGLLLKTMLICSILEYFTSYVMEKIFKTRWWDYRSNKFNINGRICLETIILFGIGGCIIVYFINPFLLSTFDIMPNLLLVIISSILLGIFIIDVVLSFTTIIGFKRTTADLKKDSTEEISKKVREVLSAKSYLTKRLVDAFPNLETINKKFQKK